MSQERDLLKRWITESLMINVVYKKLLQDTKKLLAQPEKDINRLGIPYDPSPKFDQKEFDEMVEKGTKAWAGVDEKELREGPELNKKTEEYYEELLRNHVVQIQNLEVAKYKLQKKYDARQRPKPLTDDQIRCGYQSCLNMTNKAFKEGVKYAEKLHGIGESNE